MNSRLRLRVTRDADTHLCWAADITSYCFVHLTTNDAWHRVNPVIVGATWNKVACPATHR